MAKKKNKRRPTQLRSKRVSPKISSSVRNVILKAMEQKDWTAYRLAKELSGKVSEQAVYAYVAGRRDITTKFLPHVLAALGLEIRVKE